MENDKVLVPARVDDIPVGAPLAFALYGRSGALIAPPGFAVPDEAARAKLLGARPYREATGVARDEPGGASEPVPTALGGAEHDDPLHRLRHNVEGVQLVFRLPGDPDKRVVPAGFCGRLGMQSLLVAAPALGGHRSWHQLEGLEVAVRMTAGRTAYVFDSAVQRYSALPSPHLYLRYPVSARRSDFRAAVRLETSLPAVAQMNDARRFGVTIVDLSGAGCAVDSQHLLGELGDRFTLVFRAHLSEGSFTLTVPVVIRNLPKAGARHRMRHGLQFGDGSDDGLEWHLRLAIKAFIYESLLEA